MKVNIIGGGPSGLFLAALLKARDSAAEISVYEQNPRGATYGFGVGLADSAIGKLRAADPETMDALRARMVTMDSQVIENSAGEFSIEFAAPMGTITRLDILDVLLQRCAELGVTVHHEVRIDSDQTLDELADADLLVGADGANSVLRRRDEAGFGTTSETRPNRFAWFGCRHPQLGSGLRFRQVQRAGGSGCMIAHYYSYTPEMWTFLPEVDEASWHALGMAEMSDEERKAFVEECFADVLEGRPLVDNRSAWSQFTTVVNDRWYQGNRVLLGDALFRAHFSIGSGTRLAMEDSLGLADALCAHPGNVAAALETFESVGKPRKAKLMAACEASYRWYESAAAKLDMPILDFISNFMDRTGRMPEERLRSFIPNFAEAYLGSSRQASTGSAI